MKMIRQHGDAGALYDLRAFVNDFESMLAADSWEVRIDECTGNAALALEELTAMMPRISHGAFQSLAESIHQTIDGVFVAHRDGREAFRLVAVDSSFWEVSGDEALEEAMLRKYGAYGS